MVDVCVVVVTIMVFLIVTVVVFVSVTVLAIVIITDPVRLPGGFAFRWMVVVLVVWMATLILGGFFPFAPSTI